LFTSAGLCQSNGDARRLLKGGGAYINDERISSVDMNVKSDAFADGFIILKAGKKNIKKITLK
ncbi:MAG: hypothetical protein KAS17_09080, partial [Victivallaceae bacterium]|nr:hypothetical protein [Victivallaceae bacterium]